jgi:Ca2+-binding EF-hand superfamily protein
MLERFDANHNGTIDPEEREAMKAQREARRAEMLKKYDADGDGKLSDSEREALRKDMREQHEQKHQESENR